MAFQLGKISTWDDPFRTGGSVREYAKKVIPKDAREALTGGLGFKRAYASGDLNIPAFGAALGADVLFGTPEQMMSGAKSTGGTSGGTVYGPEKPGVDTSTGTMPNTNTGASADAVAKAKAIADARARYIEKYARNQQFRDYAKQYATDEYNTAVSRAGEQKGILGSQYGRQREQMQTGLQGTQGALSGAYSSRGLGDSSFAQKAKAQADLEFNNNLMQLNENEAAQYKEIDNYLSDLAKQREYKLQEISLEDFNTEAEYQDAINSLDAELASIQSQQASLRDSVSTVVGKITGSTSIDNTMKFQEALNSILGTAMPASQRKSVLSGFLASTGNKTPDKAADYWMSWYDAQNAISEGKDTEENANKTLTELYGTGL